MTWGRRLGWAALLWAGWRVFGPELPPRFNFPQVLPEAPMGRLVRAGEHEFLVREAGPAGGPPLFLIHGWAYDSFATWHRIAPMLADSHRVLAPDQRNHGKSDHIRERYSLADSADDMAAVMDALELGPVPVVGYSMGGMVAQELARRHPGRVSRLVLAATAAYPVPRRRTAVAAYLLAARLGKISMREALALSHRYLIRNGVVPPEHARWLWEALRHRDVDLYVAGGWAIWQFDSRSWVGDLPQPVQVIIPDSDQLIPPVAQHELVELLGGVPTVVLESARHEAMLTHAEEIAEAIRQFV